MTDLHPPTPEGGSRSVARLLGLTARVPTRLAVAGAAGLVALAGIAVAVTGSASDNGTVLHAVAATTVVDTSGVSRVAHDGSVVTAGEQVITADAGHATLTTGGRAVLLGASSRLVMTTVSDLELRSGTVLVDRRHGPAAIVDAGLVQVDAGHSAVRVERGVSVRVATLDGRDATVTAPGASMAVPGLDQVVVAGIALPTAPSPLQLTDDAFEQAVVPDLVHLDTALQALAKQVDADPVTSAAAYRPTFDNGLPVDPTAPASERELTGAIGDAGSGSGASAGSAGAATRRALAARVRAALGSWGVVAAGQGADEAGVRSALAGLLDATDPVTVVAAGPDTTGLDSAGLLPPTTGSSAAATSAPGVVAAPRPSSSPAATGGARPSAAPTSTAPAPSPTTPAGPLPSTGVGVVDTVTGLVNGLLAPAPKASAAAPTASSAGGLLGTGLLAPH